LDPCRSLVSLCALLERIARICIVEEALVPRGRARRRDSGPVRGARRVMSNETEERCESERRRERHPLSERFQPLPLSASRTIMGLPRLHDPDARERR
jgi:hypothetical protein